MATARDVAASAIGALVSGAAAAAVVLLLFRFDARTVPAYLAASMLLEAAVMAAQKGTPSGVLNFALYAVTVVALAWAANRWIARQPAGDASAGRAAGSSQVT